MMSAIQLIVPNTMLGRFMSIAQLTGAGPRSARSSLADRENIRQKKS